MISVIIYLPIAVMIDATRTNDPTSLSRDSIPERITRVTSRGSPLTPRSGTIRTHPLIKPSGVSCISLRAAALSRRRVSKVIPSSTSVVDAKNSMSCCRYPNFP